MKLQKLSIIIVSYNEWEYLSLTLQSVEKAISNIQAEILLVDNSTHDKIKEKVTRYFPFVKIVPNNKNLGFAKANNLAIKQAKGDIALLLNPDILLAEDSLEKVIHFYNEHPDAGGLGVKMLNGHGIYLKESKRGLTTPLTALFKMCGLTRLLPNSKTFAPYYHGHLDENSNHCVDVLSGAFLAQSKAFIQFDERYFMYGEDIDLSYQIAQNKGTNYYWANNPIIHFKGKTTRTNAFIIKHFYNAMWLFYSKNLIQNYSKTTSLLVRTGIILGQYIALTKLFFQKKMVNKKPKPVHKPILISTNSDSDLAIQIKSECNMPNLIQVQSTSEIKESNNGELLIFDLKTIPSREVITLMDNYREKFKYVFLSHDNKYLFTNENLPDKKDVIELKPAAL